MKCLLFFALSFSAFIAHGFSNVGGVDGGGGKSVVCRNSNGSIQSAEVLDLYEARVQYRLKVAPNTLPYMQQALQAIEPLKKTIPVFEYNGIVNSIGNLEKIKNILPKGTKLQEVNDAFPVVLPENCSLEQAANYYNDSNILFNGEIWEAFDEQNRAALVVHEAIYRFMRTYGAKDSQKARLNVGHLFASTPLEPVATMNPKHEIWRCGSKRINATTKITEFYADVDANNLATIWFRILNNEYLFTSTKLINVPFWMYGIKGKGWYLEGGRAFYSSNLISQIDQGRNINLSLDSIVTDYTTEQKFKADVGDRYSTPETEILCEIVNKP